MPSNLSVVLTKRWRDFHRERRKDENIESKNILDGMLLERFSKLPIEEKEKIYKQLSSHVESCDELCRIVESLEKNH